MRARVCVLCWIFTRMPSTGALLEELDVQCFGTILADYPTGVRLACLECAVFRGGGGRTTRSRRRPLTRDAQR